MTPGDSFRGPQTPEDSFRGAQKILWRYYERAVNDLASDVIRHRDQFERRTDRAEEILEQHYNGLCNIASCYRHLRNFSSKDKTIDS